MADNVISVMDNKAREEEEKIRKYEQDKEAREMMIERQRQEKSKHDKSSMADFLFKQMQEKKEREIMEKKINDE